MEFDGLGKHCQQAMCGQRDILPFQCQFCKMTLCFQHRDTKNHTCLSEDEFRALGLRNQEIELVSYMCSLPNCVKESNVKISCPCCDQLFCLGHRNPELHECQFLPEPISRKTMSNPKAAELLQSRKGSLSKNDVLTNSQRSTKDEALQRRIRLTRIKMKANNQGVLENRRLYLEVHGIDPKTGGNETNVGPVYLCMDRFSTIGKLLDHCAKLLKIANNNNSMSNPNDKLYLSNNAYKVSNSGPTYRLDSRSDPIPFSNELHDTLQDGDVIILYRGLE